MAARFTFRFETLLRLRKQREDEKKRLVAARLNRIGEVRQRQDNLKKAISEHADQMRRSLRGEQLDVDQLRWERHWLTHLRRGVLEAESELTSHRAQLAQERSGLIEARKEAEVLARLKERRREAYLAHAARQELMESDEAAAVRFAFSRSDESEVHA